MLFKATLESSTMNTNILILISITEEESTRVLIYIKIRIPTIPRSEQQKFRRNRWHKRGEKKTDVVTFIGSRNGRSGFGIREAIQLFEIEGRKEFRAGMPASDPK